MTDQQREDQILAAGRHLVSAYEAGDRATARAFLLLQTVHIKERIAAEREQMRQQRSMP